MARVPARATATDYRDMLLRLLPFGAAWDRATDGRLAALLLWVGDELARVHNRCLDLLTEADPRTTNPADAVGSSTGLGGLLEDWERVLGLPDPCSDTPLSSLTIVERRLAAAGKLTAQGGVIRQYFIGLAKAMGYTVTIEEPLGPWRCDSPCDQPVYDVPWAFAWIVHATYDAARFFRCDTPCDRPLVEYGTDDLVCTFERLRPMHTTIHWEFTAAAA